MHGGVEHPASPRVGGWSMRMYKRVLLTPAMWFGTAALVLTLFRVQPIFLWTLLLTLFAVLGIRVALRHGHELHHVAAAIFVGVPLGAAIAVIQLALGQLDGSAADIFRWPLTVSFFGAVVMSGAGLMITGWPKSHHILLAHHKPHRHRS